MQYPTVLIHGLFGTLADNKILSAISDNNIYAPDLIGYGEHRDAATGGITLQDQADHIATWINSNLSGPVNIVGHSVGGAIAMLFADMHPSLTASITNVEGNFTFGDAMWTSKLAKMDNPAVEQTLEDYKADVKEWLVGADVEANDWTLNVAGSWLNHQPASTLKAQSQAVLDTTRDPAFLEKVRALLKTDIPVNLIAGERSRSDWCVPDWVVDEASCNFDISDAGHMMMLNAPEVFGRVVRAVCV